MSDGGYVWVIWDCLCTHLTDLVMSHLVIIQIAAGCESLATDSALMGLLATVDPPAC